MTQRPGRKGYYADFIVHGRRVQKKLGTDLGAAKSILIELRSRAEKGEWGLLDNDYPLADLRAAYLARCGQELAPSTVRAYGDDTARLLAYLGDPRLVSHLTVAGVLDYRRHRLAQGKSPRTVNRDTNHLTWMLSWGVNVARVIASNPLAGLSPLPDLRPKEGRALEDGEVRRLLEASRGAWRDVFYAYLVTGLRKMELSRLLWSDVDWEGRELVVRKHRAKNKRERRVPVEDGLWAILCRLRDEVPLRRPGTVNNPKIAENVRRRFTRDHVFVTPSCTPVGWSAHSTFLRTCRRAGIETHTWDAEGNLLEHVDVHSLRRTFATNLIVGGADPKSVQELLGHKSLTTTMKIYAKVRGVNKRAALGKLSYGGGVTPPDHVLPLAGVGG
jgi:integrase